MRSKYKYDVLVIGGGPAGYTAAIRASQLGKKVACIEENHLGGTCLNWGCIPSKHLLHVAESYSMMGSSANIGLSCNNIKVDFLQIMRNTKVIINNMRKNIFNLLKKNSIDYISARAVISTPNTVEILTGGKIRSYISADKILIATGCSPKPLANISINNHNIFNVKNILNVKKQPKSIAILGAGAIGVEFAYFFNAIGTNTFLLERSNRVLPSEDTDLSNFLKKSLSLKGVAIHNLVKVESFYNKGSHVNIKFNSSDRRSSIKVDSLLLAIGVKPNTENLFSGDFRIELRDGFVAINDEYQTSCPNIYAIGDVVGPPWLAHVAMHEALQLIDILFNCKTYSKISVYPRCTYCQPQVASVGLTERVVRKSGIKYLVGRFPFTSLGKAIAVNATEGFVKIIVDGRRKEILGAHIIGCRATEMIAELTLAIQLEITIEEIILTIHAHPTFSESIAEVSLIISNKKSYL